MLSFYGIIKFVKYAINVESKPPENITAIFESLFIQKSSYLSYYLSYYLSFIISYYSFYRSFYYKSLLF